MCGCETSRSLLRWSWLFLACSLGLFWSGARARVVNVCDADLTITYRDLEAQVWRSESLGVGRFGANSKLEAESGLVVHVKTEDGENHACSPLVNVPTRQHKWIALVQRGACKFQDKVLHSAILKNASAVVVYNNVLEDDLITMKHQAGSFVSVFMGLEGGARVASLVDSGLRVHMNISVGQMTVYNVMSNSSMAASTGLPSHPTFIFVSLGLLLVVVLGLICLLIYGVRRARYARNKSRARIVFTLPAAHQDLGQVQEGLLNSIDYPDNTDSTAIYLPNGQR